MTNPMYPFWAALLSNIIAQGLKPVFHLIRFKKFRPLLIFDSGGLPSSHTAMVSALALSVGLREHFSSTTFAITLVLALIVMYDAANVRFYAGRNIQITKQLIQDIREVTQSKFDNPIYMMKVKEVLGHKWIEVISGVIIGLVVAGGLYYIL